MELENPTPGVPATPDEVRAAIDGLGPADFARLKKAAALAMYGSEFTNPQELINEAVARAFSAASGQQGRVWTHPVKFMAFMIMTIRGIANDSAESASQTRTVRYQAMAVDGGDPDEVLGNLGNAHASVEEDLIESQEMLLRQARAKQDCDAIEGYFKGDEIVGCVILGMKDGMTPKEICDFAEINKTQHDTARTRIRRGMEKLYPGRREK